ncbi:NUDIX domain-containing protein [Rhizobiales bacterium RZME27]|jgi:8-oxo-dGTP pyrophosphatase MutT (NUDIX family)|uniref:NUDIX domain-containing protein n=1 Tax=Endobacterium cereale TaxID=2663029 RepID=A0A6A8AFL9_9HYPH|nr:NUDIX hydrolase [Endobacterium cereale]MQY49574.1 NUDIX domain-containing protein [Endobacterium cereale]
MLATSGFKQLRATIAIAVDKWLAPAQAAAICVRFVDGAPQILLISNRARTRWGIPKGHVEVGETSWQAAQREAFEEAGIMGSADPASIGEYRYSKIGELKRRVVKLHVVHVEACLETFREEGLREMKWVNLPAAAGSVGYPELGQKLNELLLS